jgi:inosine-uridine nucleoside N-ribohydrolase
LGNLAAALLLEPDLPQLVRDVIVMGGTVLEPGNVSPVAEANVWNDPHAADIVFNAGYASPVRTPRGRDILAACGQLKSDTEKLRARARLVED